MRDASGDLSEMASRTTLARLTQGGVIPVSTNVVAGEFQRSWNRPDAADWGKFYGELVPHYHAVAESYKKAQDAAKEPKTILWYEGDHLGKTRDLDMPLVTRVMNDTLRFLQEVDVRALSERGASSQR